MNNYLKYIQEVLGQLNNKGYCEDAKLLNEKIGNNYFDTSSPHFFTGNLNAELVMVQLNAKREKSEFNKPKVVNYEKYIEDCTNYGRHTYGGVGKSWKSAFDQKMIRFLKPLEILPFTGEIMNDLEIVSDKKLQLELVPFGSPDFNYKEIGIANLKPFIERILELILSADRQCVIFCGRVFSMLLNDYFIDEKKHRFKLKKVNGDLTRDYFELIEVTIQLKDKKIKAVIAPQYAKHGYPINEYGNKLKELIIGK